MPALNSLRLQVDFIISPWVALLQERHLFIASSPFVMNKPHGQAPSRSLTVLDPRTLGRPVHLLGNFTARLKSDLLDGFVGDLNKRYRAAFQVESVTMSPCGAKGATQVQGVRWLPFASDVGRIGVSLDRRVLLTVLRYRYGLHDAGIRSSPTDDQTPETASERRLAAMLGVQLIEALARCIDTLSPAVERMACPSPVFTPLPGPVSTWGEDAWTVTVALREASQEVAGCLDFKLDGAWVARLLRHLTPVREQAGTPVGAASHPLGARLPVHIVARLVEQEMPLGALLDMRVGDVIPVHLGAADVLVEQSKLFQASVAEHKGKLCLTSFEDAQ